MASSDGATKLRNLANVRGLQALGTLHRIELHGLALGEAAKAFTDDGGVMDENVRSALRSDEAKALCVVEPLHGAFCHFRFPVVPGFYPGVVLLSGQS